MEFLTANELSHILKLHPFTVTRLAREGKLPGVRVGGAWRFRKEQFIAWLARQERSNLVKSGHVITSVRRPRKSAKKR